MSEQEQVEGNGGHLTVIEPERRAITKVDEWEDTARSIRHSFDVSTDEGRINYIACLTGSDVQAQHSTGKPFTVIGYLLHVVDRVDEKTGQVFDGLRLVFLTEDGQRISTGSGPLIDNWAHVVSMFKGTKPFPRLAVELAAVKATCSPGHYLQIKSLRMPPAPKTAVRK